MKYTATDKHPYLKKGTEIERFNRNSSFDNSYNSINKEYYSKYSVVEEIEKGWITREVKVLKWTDNDIRDLYHDWWDNKLGVGFEEFIEDWLKLKSK